MSTRGKARAVFCLSKHTFITEKRLAGGAGSNLQYNHAYPKDSAVLTHSEKNLFNAFQETLHFLYVYIFSFSRMNVS